MAPLAICFAAAEMAPFAKTGGLADVASALPRYLHDQGHDVRPFMPLYSRIDLDAYDFVQVDFLRDVAVDLGGHRLSFTGYAGRAPGSDLAVYFIHCPALYHRRSIYTGDADEHLRFAFFSHAVFACCQRMGWGPQVLHVNDWHTALMPLYRRTTYGWDQLFAGSRSVLTIHNIAYQGIFPAAVVPELGLAQDHHLLYQDDLRAGVVNFLKTGILYADVVTTVSETYAKEIQTEAFGCGLEGVLRQRGGSVLGIVNGVDYGTWDPRNDPHLPVRYGPEDVAEGKRRNKELLLAELGLPVAEGTPLFGIVSRLTAQKGFELLFEPLPEMLAAGDAQIVVLGTGEASYERFFHQLQQRFPAKACYYRGYNEPLAHRIEAASDFFLMPSRFEPCGLNQMYSLKYGSVPIVRKTGGLADTVRLFDPRTGDGTGIVFEHFEPDAVRWALGCAVELYRDPQAMDRLRRNGMAEDFSWQRQGKLYERLYRLLAAGG
ncbi:MAG: glycogen synthase [Acidobacteria bacterium]|nr:MAG: glycogen synthase [Acidobacteriota bacterium]